MLDVGHSVREMDQSCGTNSSYYRCFRPAMKWRTSAWWRPAVSAETKLHCRSERGITPFRCGNAHRSLRCFARLPVSAKCIAIANSGFFGAAVMSTAGCFGDGGGEGRCNGGGSL